MATRISHLCRSWYRDDKWSPSFPSRHIIKPTIHKKNSDGTWTSFPSLTPIEKWRGEIRKMSNKRSFIESLYPYHIFEYLQTNGFVIHNDSRLKVLIKDNFHLIDRIYDELC